MKKPIIEPQSIDVYERLRFKIREGFEELSVVEREKLEDLFIDNYTVQITRMSDKDLIEKAGEEEILF